MKREKRLERIFSEEIKTDLEKQYNKNISNSIHSELKNEFLVVFKNLGGIEEHYNYRGRVDLVFNNMVIELDEQLHFNRYRINTLESSLYDLLPKFPHQEYLNYCRSYESECLKSGKHGGRWSNSSCDRMFGKANSEGKLDQNGSSRWKQRAFNDFVKDASYLITNIPVVRLSIYQNILIDDRSYSLGEALQNEGIPDEILKKEIELLINDQIL